jgi:hypothetical protein
VVVYGGGIRWWYTVVVYGGGMLKTDQPTNRYEYPNKLKPELKNLKLPTNIPSG